MLFNSSFIKSWGLRNEGPQLKRTVDIVHIVHSLNSTEMVDGCEVIKGSKEMRKGMGKERVERGQAE
jgi:hypothetical protein